MHPELQEIKLLRKRLGLTQVQLAAAAKVSQSLIAKIESGDVDPSFSAAKSVLEALRNAERAQEPTAKQLLQRNVISCAPGDKVAAIIAMMRKRAISQLPVTEHDNVVGIVTESTIIGHLERLSPKLAVKEIMDEAPPIIPPETPKRVVVELLQYAPLAIVKEKGKIVGIITKADLLRTA